MKLKPGPLMAKAKNDAPDAGGNNSEVVRLTRERDDARGEAAKLAEELAVLKTQLDGLKAATPPEPERAADLPDGIAEGEVRERIRASGGALTRAQAIRAVQRQHERDALLAEPARE